MRVAFSTFGCKINQFESEELKKSFLSSGNTVVSFDEPADIYVINTCTVTGKSDYQCRQAIKSAIKRGNGAQVIVTGCYAETNPDAIKKLGGGTKIVGNSEKQLITAYAGVAESISPSQMLPVVKGTRTRSVIKIQDGCESYCSYCIIPHARGKSRSIPPEEVIERFKALVEIDSPEIVLSGIHIGKYGKDINSTLSLSALVSELICLRGSTRIRLSSIEPREVTPEIINMLGKGLCRHLHIPLQSGDDEILKAMNRDYSVHFYREIIRDVAAQVNDVAIGADVIVGFPGESIEHFQNTVELIEDIPLTHLHVFSYSPRPGTIAFNMKNHVSDKNKKLRNEELRSIGLKKNYEFRKRCLGKILQVIIEPLQRGAEMYSGMSDNYVRVSVQGVKEYHIGNKIDVSIVKVSEQATIGRAL